MAPAIPSTGSSPDPLSMSRDTYQPGLTPIKSPTARNLRVRTNSQRALRESSPNVPRTPSPDKKPRNASSSPLKQNLPITYSMDTPSKTPSKTNEGSGQNPLTIKLTLGLKPANEVQNDRQGSKSAKKGGNNSVAINDDNVTTTTVPLRGGDEHSPLKRRSKAAIQQSAAIEMDEASQQDAQENQRKRGRGRPRKSLPQPTEPATSDVQDNTISDMPESNDQHADKGVPSSRRDISSLTPLRIRLSAGLKAVKRDQAVTPFGQVRTRSQKISQRIPTPRRPINFDESTMSSVTVSSPVQVDARQKKLLQHESQPNSNNNRTGMEDDTLLLNLSAAESEGFSMVSLDSLRSHREKAEREAQQAMAKEALTHSNVAQTGLPSTEKADIQQDSHATNSHRQRTPSANLTRTTSPPRIQSSPLRPSPAKISPAARAGAALQRALTEDRQLGPVNPSSTNKVTPKPTQYRNAFLEGFGDRSNRELRAGLAMGELLARKQITSQKESSRTSAGNMAAPKVPFPFSRLPTPAESQQPSSDDSKNGYVKDTRDDTLGYKTYDDMSWRPTSPPSKLNVSQEASVGYDEMSWKPTTPYAEKPGDDADKESEVGHSTFLEREIQREREEVIRQAKNVNTSQIIVIDSNENSRVQEHDDSVEDATMHDVHSDIDADIWQEEAERSMEESRTSDTARRQERKRKLSDNVSEETPDWRDLIAEDTRPPRAKLPRTWRRESGSHFLYSDETTSPAGQKVSSHNAQVRKSPNLKLYFQDQSNIEDNEASLPSTKSRELQPKKKGICTSPTRGTSPNKEVHFEKMADDLNRHTAMSLSGSKDHDIAIEESASMQNSGEDELGEENDVSEPVHESRNLKLGRHDRRETANYFSDMPEFDDSYQVEAGHYDDNQDIEETVYHHSRESESDTADPDDNSSNSSSPLLSTSEPRQQLNQREVSDPSAISHQDYRQVPHQAPATQQTVDTVGYELAIKVVAQPGLLTRIKNWLYPPPPPPPCRKWTLNHYMLLGPFYQISQLPDAPTGPIPSDFKPYIDRVYVATHEGRIYRHTMTAPRVFAAAAFTNEVRYHGVPLMADPSQDRNPWWVKRYINAEGKEVKVCPKGIHYPIRDEHGRVKRVQEEWGARDVIIRFFSLLCQDEYNAYTAAKAAAGAEKQRTDNEASDGQDKGYADNDDEQQDEDNREDSEDSEDPGSGRDEHDENRAYFSDEHEYEQDASEDGDEHLSDDAEIENGEDGEPEVDEQVHY